MPGLAERPCEQVGSVRLYEDPFGSGSPGYEGPPPETVFLPATITLSAGGVYSIVVEGVTPITGLDPSVSFQGSGPCISEELKVPLPGSIWSGDNLSLSILSDNCIEVVTAQIFKQVNPDLAEVCNACGFKDAISLIDAWADDMTPSRLRLVVSQLRRATSKLTPRPSITQLEDAVRKTLEALPR